MRAAQSHRGCFDALPPNDPLQLRDEPSVVLACGSAGHAERAPFSPHLADGLTRSWP